MFMYAYIGKFLLIKGVSKTFPSSFTLFQIPKNPKQFLYDDYSIYLYCKLRTFSFCWLWI